MSPEHPGLAARPPAHTLTMDTHAGLRQTGVPTQSGTRQVMTPSGLLETDNPTFRLIYTAPPNPGPAMHDTRSRAPLTHRALHYTQHLDDAFHLSVF